ncbi:MAG TPA: NADH-quinone oxidoreductase subunit L [Chitinophagaceae bacterium]|nr:NADH-quinone oxidoreductase subunit L [Chitinophagaceae bacterium]HPH30916.1 NADH-quinone oxidoreductase subunit L [Chitinophagaceae bacterium]HPN57682.1 NADH-quinone oxidoreductase subunit L [Chitinophagaceae bacterium]
MPNATNIALIPLLPLAAFVLLGLFGRKYLKSSAGLIGTALLLGSALLAFYTAYDYFFVYGKVDGVYQQFIPMKFTWLAFTKEMSIDMGLVIDPISVMMLVVVTLISLMVHIYSLGYLKGEERFSTYYAYLGLFTFSMLGLVLASNIFQIYIFWELVGLSSFLLIGFYYDKPSAVAASKKAFIVTRFADLGFLIGILVLSYCSGTFDFQTMISRLTDPESNEVKNAVASTFLGASALTWGAALVFIGGAGKSAMFPLHIWLPDAMEGPTPVSALIHAATMVVAGVYLVARLFPVFSVTTPGVLEVIGWVGAISAVIAAVIACTQTDIKRVLAYSTMSQIGYMMFALGVSKYGGEAGLGYTASMFHLFTHAMFKALLFLGAGAVIHYVHSNEMKDMGGLRKKMPITHITFLVACLAIAGVPPLAGFFSKEEILLAAYHSNTTIYWIALITSGLTAFYMFRLYFNIFWNKPYEAHGEHHSHGSASATSTQHASAGKEGGFVMMMPLVLLSVGAAAAGFIPFGELVSTDGKALESHFSLSFSAAPVALGLAGILLALWMYAKNSDKPAKLAASLGGLYKAAYHKFYIDELYLFITKKILFNIIGRAAAWFDRTIVDGLVNLTGNTTVLVSEGIKKIQSGKVQQYAIIFLGGVILLAVLFIYVFKPVYF